MELKEMIKVMKHFDKGGIVECTESGFDYWAVANTPCWDWFEYDYRIKEPKQKVTIEKWLCIDEDGDYDIINVSNIDKYRQYEKIKLIETYEVEL